MADITEVLPLSLAQNQVAQTFSASNLTPDVTVGDIPFLLYIKDDYPYDRQTADYRRQQIDTSKEPGEQTLSQWWVRDQSSWHKGGGINFYEPGSVATTEFRYASSYGLDVWTQGQITLLRKTDQAFTGAGNNYVTGAVVSGADVIFKTQSSTLSRWDGTTVTTYTGASPTTEPVVAGASVIAGSTSGIHLGSVSGSTLTTPYTSASGNTIRPWWAKSRIIAADGNKLFDLTLTGTGAMGGLTPLYTHPSTGFTWTAVADAPGGILAAGYANGYGYIYRFTLTEGASGTTPTLGAGTQVAEFPPGEEVHSLRVYLASYVAIGTSKGLRIGLVDDSSNLAYGPLIVQTTKPVRCLSARDTYVFAGIEADINGNSGCARVDLSEAISDLRFPWAYDVQTTTNAQVQSISFFGLTDRVVLGISGQGVWRQSATEYQSSGVLTSGWIRYATAEPKLFNRAKVRASISGGSTVTLGTVNSAGSSTNIVVLGETFNTDDDITLGALAGTAQDKAKIVLTLTAGSSNTTTPTVQSFQVKATPVPGVQRNISYPLKLHDKEADRKNVKVGYPGYAWDRLRLLEELERTASVVTIKDYTNGETYSAQIVQVRVIRDTPPERGDTGANFGGLLYLKVLML